MSLYTQISDKAGTAMAGLRVSPASREDWRIVERWIERQGWDPGVSDADVFYSQDPAGFFVGSVNGEIVSSIAIVNYDERFAYLGHYLVRPDMRGHGLGLATWQAAVHHAGSRTIGLESGNEHLAKYRRSGFVDAYRTRHFAGRVRQCVVTREAVPAETVPVSAIAAYDAQVFPADRPAFLARWLTAPGHRSFVYLESGRVVGYGVIREAVSGLRVGPLVADRPEVAQALFASLIGEAGQAEVSLEAPETNPHAAALAGAWGLSPAYETVRMYTGPVRPTAHALSYAIASFELG